MCSFTLTFFSVIFLHNPLHFCALHLLPKIYLNFFIFTYVLLMLICKWLPLKLGNKVLIVFPYAFNAALSSAGCLAVELVEFSGNFC